jgi:hypothetical protein
MDATAHRAAKHVAKSAPVVLVGDDSIVNLSSTRRPSCSSDQAGLLTGPVIDVDGGRTDI